MASQSGDEIMAKAEIQPKNFSRLCHKARLMLLRPPFSETSTFDASTSNILIWAQYSAVSHCHN